MRFSAAGAGTNPAAPAPDAVAPTISLTLSSLLSI
nr:MAG TPA: hypothetical protein [Herelleviridae sp.]